MLAAWVVVLMLFGHWLSDFVWQPDWMAKGKSSNWWTLAEHSCRITYGMAATGAAIVLLAGRFDHLPSVFWWGLVNGVGHFAIDAVSSRITGRLFRAGRTHDFFTVIGFDQFLHLALAVSTLWVIL